MKTLLIFVAVSILSPLISNAYTTENTPIACGYSDFIFSKFSQWTQEKATLHLPFTGQQSESGRRFLMYGDNSWILTFEFFAEEDPAYDVSCIVRVGTEVDAYEATTAIIESLPTQRIGPVLRSKDENRIKL